MRPRLRQSSFCQYGIVVTLITVVCNWRWFGIDLCGRGVRGSVHCCGDNIGGRLSAGGGVGGNGVASLSWSSCHSWSPARSVVVKFTENLVKRKVSKEPSEESSVPAACIGWSLSVASACI